MDSVDSWNQDRTTLEYNDDCERHSARSTMNVRLLESQNKRKSASSSENLSVSLESTAQTST